MKNYCMDCAHYIPGGKAHNCMAWNAYRDTVCPLKDACCKFKPKEEEQ